MTECIIYEKSRTRLEGVRYIRAIQVNKTGGDRSRGRGGGGGGGSAGKEFHQFLKRSLAGERMGRARLPKTARADRGNEPRYCFESQRAGFPGGKIVFYMRLEALRSSLVTIRLLLLLHLLLLHLLLPLLLPSPSGDVRRKLDANQIYRERRLGSRAVGSL